jgi:hypothetical protein
LLDNPALNLGDTKKWEIQVNEWLQQIALDAGFSGMESLLAVDR